MHKRTIKHYTVKRFAFKSPGVNKLNFVATYGIHYLNLIEYPKYELYVEFNYIPQYTLVNRYRYYNNMQHTKGKFVSGQITKI